MENFGKFVTATTLLSDVMGISMAGGVDERKSLSMRGLCASWAASVKSTNYAALLDRIGLISL